MKTKSILLGLIVSGLFTFSSYAQSDNRERKEPPTVDEIFEQMDADEDGQLSEEEVKGPIKEMFSKIDSNEDGYLSTEEVENAPKPEGRGPKR